jgi:hypothetical protein
MKEHRLVKNSKYVLLLLLVISFILPLSAQTKKQFQFRKDLTFKIAQFTDLHWDNNSANCAKTIETIQYVLSTEQPDIAILTGDIVTATPAKEGWLAVSKIFSDAKIPWAVTLGNHDAETGISRDQIFTILEPLPYFVGSKGPQLYGCGNYSIPIIASNSKSTAAVIYCMDSNDYPKDKKIGHYDWIHFNQIDWYRKTSDKFTTSNNQSPIPSVVFFHIPIIEFNNIVGKETTIGIKEEDIASSEINSGVFASMLEKKDIMGIFVGHDHNNNFIGIDHDICLAFGEVTGADAYGKLDRGSRIIELHEGEFSFDSWIRTKAGTNFKYNYPSGMIYNDSGMVYLPAKTIKNLKPGVHYNYFEGGFKSTTELNAAKLKKSGTLTNISIEMAAVKDSFAFEFHAWLEIPRKSIYRFYTYSDDGSKLFIDGKEVVNNDGSHGAQRADGKIALDKGFHEFQLLYFQDYMGKELEVGFSSINIRECKIPDSYFFTDL